MRILQIVPALEAGGVETGTIDLSRILKEKGQKVFVISSGGRLVAELEKHDIAHIKLPVHKKSLFSLFLVPKVINIIKSHKINVVHASSRVPAWIGFLACKRTNTPFVTSCHGFYSKHFFSSVMGWGKLVMAISDTIGKRMIEDFKVPRDGIRLVHRGVDLTKYLFYPDKYNAERERFRIVNIGRLTPIKGQYEFIKAIKHVREKIPNLEVWIVGGSSKGKENYANTLRTLIDELGLKDIVKFLGTRNDIPELLKDAELLVLSTNVPEGFGRVVIEAGAIGTAVCASDVGGIKEIIDDGVSGLLFAPRNETAMAKTIIKMLGDVELRKRCACNLREKVENYFSLAKMADKTLSVYQEAIDQKPKVKDNVSKGVS